MSTASPAFHTIRDMLRLAVTRFNEARLFFGHGNSNAFDEAVYLILKSLSLPLDTLEPFLDARLTPEEISRIRRLIDRRVSERMPAAYLTTEAWLQGYRFYVDQRVIIPRSFIAELIMEQFAPWVDDPQTPHDILELCTGSGCLAIMMADAFPHAVIDAVDLSTEALDVARINVAEYEMADRINLIHSDLYQAIGQKKYDLIVTNPPYVNSASMKKLPPEYQHEPQMALAGGDDGMDLVRKIVREAGQHLNEKGLLIVEIGNEAAHAEAAFPDLALTWISTSGGDDRVFLVEASQLR
ncbi:50S ribosomal protein L3 N(5)-glutamine methyltransferase [Oxalobacter vibrioformis]|uniref:Ribosomal protein uL3 glutamine methyltransferase n=1 Tax=Oxalobacter vibrioformis TaxID=933080 RepID=A0A9E9P3V9_9BURK|nr:50S ribosomal protein L3 N(5)-glutamine methyltransferase [Oxalobacter vibrioformis]WAW10665.1 50S ribosomal protein L3 N(5)-glutamine methyltransferase [Oxalobacter vibrioformis]